MYHHRLRNLGRIRPPKSASRARALRYIAGGLSEVTAPLCAVFTDMTLMPREGAAVATEDVRDVGHKRYHAGLDAVPCWQCLPNGSENHLIARRSSAYQARSGFTILRPSNGIVFLIHSSLFCRIVIPAVPPCRASDAPAPFYILMRRTHARNWRLHLPKEKIEKTRENRGDKVMVQCLCPIPMGNLHFYSNTITFPFTPQPVPTSHIPLVPLLNYAYYRITHLHPPPCESSTFDLACFGAAFPFAIPPAA
jgi:hypothetical protein